MNDEEYWKNKKSEELFKAILFLKNVAEAERFFRDLLTAEEIRTFGERFEVAKKLSEGKTYREVASETDASTTTVTRVSQWLNRGMDGYKLVLKRMGYLKGDDSSVRHIKAASSA